MSERTFANYLRAKLSDEVRPITDYALRVLEQEDGSIVFYLHPQGLREEANYFVTDGTSVRVVDFLGRDYR